MRSGFRFRLAGRIGGLVLGGLFRTSSFDIRTTERYRALREAGQPCVYVLWHGRLLPLAYQRRGEGVVTLVSRSQDGEYIARLLERWGFSAVRGSSSRGGGPALRELIRHARAGRSIAITPDGPRGPRERLKPGALLVAQLTGLPVVPVAAAADRAWWFEGWDRFLVPRPFARIRVMYGEPEPIPRDGGGEALAAHARRIEGELQRLMRDVDDGDGA